MLSSLSLLLFFLARISIQQKDPLNDFCRRFGHQAAVVDNKLYINGGLVNWNPISENPTNISNSWLLWHNLDTSPTGIGVPQIYANLSKNASIPSVTGAIWWADEVNKRVFHYGGDHFETTPNSPKVMAYAVVNDVWDSFGAPNSPIGSVAWAGEVGVSDLGRGYALGGWLSNTSMAGWSGGALATSYLLEYDTVSGIWKNSTGPDNIPKAEGVMVYIPASDNGLLVYFGGGTTPYNNETLVASPMSLVYVYDIKSSQWYKQEAGGDVPFPRRRFCAGAVWSSDRTSYNIYLYGGMGFEANATGFDDVYILSLPSFQWIKWWQGSGVGKPHHSLTCNVVKGGQMLITGGTFPLSDACDSPSTWGMHNLDLGKQSGKMWVEYQLNITEYVVPEEVYAVIGGSPLGAATAKAPSAGFDNADLSVYFAQTAVVASRTPTRWIPTQSAAPTNEPKAKSATLSTGAIAGIAIGGGLLLVAVIALVWFCVARRRKKHLTQSATYPDHIPQYTENSYHQPSMHQSPDHMHNYATPTHPHQHHHQLQANSLPVELSASDFQLQESQIDPALSKGLFPQSTVSNCQPNYSRGSHDHVHVVNPESPVILSPNHPTFYSGQGAELSSPRLPITPSPIYTDDPEVPSVSRRTQLWGTTRENSNHYLPRY